MSDVIAKLDDWGQPAWIAVMVAAFILAWPVGLAILAYLIWSGRMGCGRRGTRTDWQRKAANRWEAKMEQWGMSARAYAPTGNRAFDEYRSETLRRLEQEAVEFQDFLEKLRHAKDKAEFEAFMTDRRSRPAGAEGAPAQGSGEGSFGGSVPQAPRAI